MKGPDENGKVIKITTDKKNSISKVDRKIEIQTSIQKNLQQVYFDSLKKIDDLLNNNLDGKGL